MIFKKQLTKIFPLIIIVGGLLAYNFMNAQWIGPGLNPPDDNVPAPLNIGGAYQAKIGDLGAIRMRAGAYCNAAGTICTTADKLGGGGGGSTITIGGRCFQPAAAVSCFWNWSGDGNDTAMYITYDLTTPQSACQGNHNTFLSYKIILAQCESSYTYTYAWTTSSWGFCQAYPYCNPQGTQSRTVSCRRSDGMTVADSFCTGTKPATSQSCAAYVGTSC